MKDIVNNCEWNFKELEFRLSSLCDHIRVLTSEKVKVTFNIDRGSWIDVINNTIKANKIDIVLIGQQGRFYQRRKMNFNPDKIAEKTNIPVLTIPENRRITKLYSVVIPITDFLPVRKLMYGLYIAAWYDTTIKLLAVSTAGAESKARHYQNLSKEIINSNCGVKIELETADSENVAEAVNEYSMLCAADLVILNPGSQTRLPGLLSRLFTKIIQKYSAPPVLTVNPG